MEWEEEDKKTAASVVVETAAFTNRYIQWWGVLPTKGRDGGDVNIERFGIRKGEVVEGMREGGVVVCREGKERLVDRIHGRFFVRRARRRSHSINPAIPTKPSHKSRNPYPGQPPNIVYPGTNLTSPQPGSPHPPLLLILL